jgi:paraquat-inducible protein A
MTIACGDCGTLEDLPLLPSRTRAICPICERSIERTAGRSIPAALACSLGTLLLLFPANLLPVMTVHLLGMERSSNLGSGVIALWNQQYFILAPLIGAFAIILPFIRFGLLTAVLGLLWCERRPSWIGSAFRWAVWLDIWAMPDVYLIGAFVGYSRVAANLSVQVDPGGYCFIAAAMLSMISRASIDRRSVWRAIRGDGEPSSDTPTLSCSTCDLLMPIEAQGQPCPRCGAVLFVRKPNSVSRAAALIAAAFILYWPANIYPMSSSLQLGHYVEYRIIDGIRELFAAHLAPLGVLIFFTSIAIPVLKIAGVGWCVASVWRRSTKHLVAKTKLYRVIDEIGRWSNVDPFTIAVFVPLMDFDSKVVTYANPGATAFILVVTFTLLASRSFDPRLMWDAAEEMPHE